MKATTQLKSKRIMTLVVISIGLCFTSFWLQGNKGFDLWDEGFLWYGVQRVAQGEIPILDFMSYDPGRYYFSAALLKISSDTGIMHLRFAVLIFQCIGLFVGLVLIANSDKAKKSRNLIFLIVSAVILLLWMFPRHKLFDISLSLFLVGLLTYMTSRPSYARYVLTGIGIGLIAVFGRNHGMYGAVGSICILAWLRVKNRSGTTLGRSLLSWLSGVCVGYLPIILMILCIPDFAAAFLESLRLLVEQKATNLPLPVPWPWNVPLTDAPLSAVVRDLIIGLFFVGTLIFGGLSILWVTRQRLRGQEVAPVLAAASFLALPYAHYAFSRADVGHLAQGIFPLLVGMLSVAAVAGTIKKWSITLLLLVATCCVVPHSHPGWYCYTTKQCTPVEISDNLLEVDPRTASDVAMLRQLAMDYAPHGQSFLAAPFWPGAYALLERKSPMWEIYSLFPRSESFQLREIERIRAASPNFVVIFDAPLDGREELRFRNTHPSIHTFVKDHFERVDYPVNPSYQIYKTRSIRQ